MTRVPEGFRIRKFRKRQKMTQGALAKEVGISVSYLNLIEHNKRPIGGKLLTQIARCLDVDIDVLSGYDDARLIQDLIDLSGNSMFRDLSMEEHGAVNIVGREPGWARAILHLHARYKETINTIELLSERIRRDPFLVETSHEILTQITAIRSLSEILNEFDGLAVDQHKRYTSMVAEQCSALSSAAKSFFAFLDEVDATVSATTPSGEVEDFIIEHRNFFPELETLAESLKNRIESYGETIDNALSNYLVKQHDIEIKRFESGMTAPGESSPTHYSTTHIDYQLSENHLNLLRWHPLETERFLIAQYIFERENSELLNELTNDKLLTENKARTRARRALARYAAGALLFPYESFLKTAIAVRYDIQALQHRFGGSFEQIVHRLVTLRNPDCGGIPFFFIRTDLAGNVSKRHSLPNLHLPRYGGACPLWALYRAFLTPGQIITQKVRMPNNQEFLYVARTVTKQAATFGASEKIFSVMFGCDSVYADQLVYGDGIDTAQTSKITEVGSNCRLCSRLNCEHRAQAPILLTPS